MTILSLVGYAAQGFKPKPDNRIVFLDIAKAFDNLARGITYTMEMHGYPGSVSLLIDSNLQTKEYS